MTDPRTDVLTLVQKCASELNPELETPIALEQGEDAPLYGREGVLDSLSLVSLILMVEERAADQFGHAVTLTSDRALSQFRSPFRTVGTLTDYVLAIAA